MAIASLLAFLLFSVYATRYFISAQAPVNQPLNKEWWNRFFRSGVVFSVIALLGVLYSNSAVILVKRFSVSAYEAGYYFASFRIYEYGMFIPQVLYTSLIPTFTKVFSISGDEFRQAFTKIFGYGLALALLFAAIISSSAEPIILTFFGEKFADAIPVLRCLGFALLNMTGFLASPALVAIGKEKWMVGFVLVALLIMIPGAYILIPGYGALGAAYAFTLSNIFGFLSVTITTFILTKARFPWNKLIKTLPVAILVFISLYFASGLSWYFWIILPVILILAGIILVKFLKIIDDDDLHEINVYLSKTGIKKREMDS
jgi:O-antigen/teichoic acid export membrane protein